MNYRPLGPVFKGTSRLSAASHKPRVKKTAFFFIFFLFAFLFPLQAAEPKGFNFDLDRFSVSLTPKILEDGTQTDFSFGMFYHEGGEMAGEIRLRLIKGSGNDLVWDIEDSLMTRERLVFEGFLLPVNYHFIRNSLFTLRAGAGIYYDYNSLQEKGYFNSASFYQPPSDEYNAYRNDFTAHALGPLVDTGLSWHLGFFRGSLSFGIVPVFYLNRNQTWTLTPFMNPTPSYTVSGGSMGTGYFYTDLDLMVTIRSVSVFVSLLHEYSRLEYKAAGFDSAGNWADVDESAENNTLKFEVSLLFALGETGLNLEAGYGRVFDKVNGGSNYFLIGTKKLWF
jgi:hypothetical protein